MDFKSDRLSTIFVEYLGQSFHGANKDVAEIDQRTFLKKFWKHQSIKSLQKRIKYKFKDKELFLRALVHSSFSHEFKQFEIKNNERLEFLGDSILQTVISIELFRNCQDEDEGKLSKYRINLVNGEKLSQIASFLNLENSILLGKGEIKRFEEFRQKILANTLEALIGAIYLDSNFKKVQKILLRIFNLFAKEKKHNLFDPEMLYFEDAKSELQEIMLTRYKTIPQYIDLEVVNSVEGKCVQFLVALDLNGIQVATVLAESKKKAHQILAKRAIKEKLYILKK